MKNKCADAVSIIGGADGPTSVFIAGRKKNRLTPKQKLQRMENEIRRRYVEKHLKAGGHTLNQVCMYLRRKLGYREIKKKDARYQEEYRQMRNSLLMQYRPELLGEYADVPRLKNHKPESIKLFMEQTVQREKAVEQIPREVFDIDLHIFTKREKGLEASISVEKRFGCIGGSASGSKRKMKRYERTFREVYRYYGVTQEDIDRRTKRYEELVRALSFR